MFDITICRPLSPARIRDGLENPLTLLKHAWDEKIIGFRRVLHTSATAAKLFPMPMSNLGGWHPDAHPSMGNIAVNFTSRTLLSLHYARATLYIVYLLEADTQVEDARPQRKLHSLW